MAAALPSCSLVNMSLRGISDPGTCIIASLPAFVPSSPLSCSATASRILVSDMSCFIV
eukprot:CAMPEP_0114159866 /NCGR_PEP_ID=MMETSP0043_2-20121206/28025_1 /TAXON_ID=464988 /ORGANISM="Hemiselmis andersenii, Strain CCMP644" /LENGTH=57 /DNA_ID=CAMNT_0001255813 /DNA_START=61 /DNA_END=234 /DNA_ORIENTATION=+